MTEHSVSPVTAESAVVDDLVVSWDRAMVIVHLVAAEGRVQALTSQLYDKLDAAELSDLGSVQTLIHQALAEMREVAA